jgi:adenylate cyclase
LSRRTILRAWLSLSLLLPFFLHARGDLNLMPLAHLEQLAYDARLRLTLPGGFDPRIVIVDIDERSLSVEGRWPWPRDRLARLLTRLTADYGALVVGLDVVFAEAEEDAALPALDILLASPLAEDPAARSELTRMREALAPDARLAESIAGAPIVLGYVFQRTAVTTGALPSPLFGEGADGTRIPFSEALGYTGNLPELQRAAAGGGFFDNPALDRDGVYRRVPVLQRYQGALYESFALALARLALGSPPVAFSFHSGPDGPRDGLDLDWIELGTHRVPVDEQAAVLVPYRGPQGTFPHVSATDVMSGAAAQYPLQGAIVLVGTSAAGLRDTRVTPVGEAFDGVEIHANLIAGILDGSIRQHPRYVQGIELVQLGAVAVLLTSIMLRAPLLGACLGVLAVELLLALASVLLWERAGLAVPVASAMLLGVVLFVAQLLYGYFAETRRQRQLSALFGQYVPPELVEQMTGNPEHFDAGISTGELTVLFADVRNFTCLAERLEARDLSALVNELLTALTQVIHRNGGTIDKYMGDAIMAFWGAPVPDREHARHALQAAREMPGALLELGPRLRERGWPELTIGIGINTGVMRVGHMGSRFRQSYTVMGDAVNLGARIEGLTKMYGVSLAVGEATAAAVPDIAFLELDRVRVQGKDVPVAIYEPLGARAELPARTRRMREQHTAALDHYRRRDWDSAESAFFALHQAHPERALFRIYLDRIAACRARPPADEWDGVYSPALK